MKFLSKAAESDILKQNFVYKKGSTKQNAVLRKSLLIEQKGFCAYTEEYLLENTLSPEVEHFNPDKKRDDDYYNYYVVSRFANQRKMKIDRKGDYKSASFFATLFFQNKDEFNERVKYKDGIYKAMNENDIEATQFIEYMGFNNEIIFKKRANAMRRLKNSIGNFSDEEKIEYLKDEEKDILSFPTAIETEFNLDLSNLLL